MKKVFTGFALLLLSTTSYAETFQCTGYLDGAVVGETISVNASKVIVAETKAHSRMKKMKLDIDYVLCK